MRGKRLALAGCIAALLFFAALTEWNTPSAPEAGAGRVLTTTDESLSPATSLAKVERTQISEVSPESSSSISDFRKWPKLNAPSDAHLRRRNSIERAKELARASMTSTTDEQMFAMINRLTFLPEVKAVAEAKGKSLTDESIRDLEVRRLEMLEELEAQATEVALAFQAAKVTAWDQGHYEILAPDQIEAREEIHHEREAAPMVTARVGDRIFLMTISRELFPNYWMQRENQEILRSKLVRELALLMP